MLTGDASCACTIRVHYSGHFNESMEVYTRGDVVCYDWCCSNYILLLDFIAFAKQLKIRDPWFWFRGCGMLHFVEVTKDIKVLCMEKHLGPDRTVDLYIANPPDIYKPLASIKCADFKVTTSQTL